MNGQKVVLFLITHKSIYSAMHNNAQPSFIHPFTVFVGFLFLSLCTRMDTSHGNIQSHGVGQIEIHWFDVSKTMNSNPQTHGKITNHILLFFSKIDRQIQLAHQSRHFSFCRSTRGALNHFYHFYFLISVGFHAKYRCEWFGRHMLRVRKSIQIVVVIR